MWLKPSIRLTASRTNGAVRQRTAQSRWRSSISLREGYGWLMPRSDRRAAAADDDDDTPPAMHCMQTQLYGAGFGGFWATDLVGHDERTGERFR